MEFLCADVVVDVMQLVVLDEQGVTASTAAVANENALSAACRNIDFGGEAVSAIEHLDGDVLRHRLRAGVVDVGLPVLRKLRTLVSESCCSAAVERKDIVLAGLDVPQRNHLDQLGPVRSGQVIGLRGIVDQVVKLPTCRIEFAQLVFRQFELSEKCLAFGEGGAGEWAYRAPAVVINGPMCEHLEVLSMVSVRRLGIIERMSEAHSFDW